MGVIIKDIAYHLPDQMVTNEDLQKENSEWSLEKVVEKSGVLQRHIAAPDETAFDLSVVACEKLFQKHDKDEIDGIIYCTQSPDYIMPPNSFLLHKKLELKKEVFAFDFNHACTGYIYGLAMANSFIKSKMGKKILLVTADTYSKYINKDDRSTRVLFGDGAAVSLLEDMVESEGIIDVELGSSGSGFKSFWVPTGGLREPKNSTFAQEIQNQNFIEMDGFGVWSFINSAAPKQIRKLLKQNGAEISDVDQFVFHQASLMTIESIMKQLKIDKDKAFMNIANVGNTVSSSIPIALKNAVDQVKVQRGEKIVLAGFGVGLSYGTILMEY